MRKIVIIANCHSMSLARSFSLGARGVEVRFIDLNFLSRDNEQDLIKRIYDGLLNEELVYSFPTSHRLSPVSTDELTPILGDRLKTFTNIRFDGLHPDCTSIGPMTGRRHSALGTYHSKIIFYAFLKGMSTSQCRKLFDYKIYERLGYFEVFNQSAQILLERDNYCDVKFASTFLSMIKTNMCLYTFNHPAGNVFQALSSVLCAADDINFVEFDASCLINDLSNNYIWSIYDEIAEYHQMPYRTPQYYMNVQSFTSRTLSRNEMILGSYEVYSRQPLEDLMHCASQAPF